MGDGKFFAIRSKLNEDRVLTIDDDEATPGQRVNLQRPKLRKGQLWYVDGLLGRIRSYQNDDLVLEIEDDHLVVNEYNFDAYNQNWQLAGEYIRHGENADMVLDVPYSKDDQGTDVQSYEYKGEDNQQWEFDYIPRKYFYIQSQLHGKVIDIEGGNSGPGAKILMWDNSGDERPNQLWWEDNNGNIRSKLNDFTFHAGHGEKIEMREFDPEFIEGLWAKSGNKIYNKADPNHVLDIKGSKTKNGTKLVKWDYEGQPNQHWTLVYV